MKNIVVIVGHARKGSYCEALGQAYVQGARSAGHDVTLLVTSRLSFDPILHEGYERVQPLEPDLVKARDAIHAATHLVLIFPLWMGTLPAIFKGFLERVLQPEMIDAAKLGKFLQPLKGKSARIVMTMGMPGLVYRWWYGAHALHMLKRNILGFIGVAPIASTLFGMVQTVSTQQRGQWLAEIEKMGARGA